MFKDTPAVNAFFGASGGYESRLEHLNHIVRIGEVKSKQFPESFGVDFSQPLSHVTNDYLTIASGTKLQTRRDEEERRILAENQSLIRRLQKYDTLETRAKHHALLATPHDPDFFFHAQGSNAPVRQAEGERINEANAELCRRIVTVKASVDNKRIAKEVAKHDQLVKQLSKFRQGKFVTCPASPRAIREQQQKQRTTISSSTGGGGSPSHFPQPPPLYKCTPAEAKGCAIGCTDHSSTSRASPLAESVLFTQQLPPPLSSGPTTRRVPGDRSRSSQHKADPMFPALPATPRNGGGGGGDGGYVAFKDDDNNQDDSPLTASGRGGAVVVPLPPSSPRSVGSQSMGARSAPVMQVSSPHKQPWQSPSVVDIQQHYQAVDATTRRAVPTKKELTERHRIVTNQGFYRRGEGSITLLGLYKSNSERMAALHAATNNNSSRSGSPTNSPRGGGNRDGFNPFRNKDGGGDDPLSSSRTSASARQVVLGAVVLANSSKAPLHERPRSFSVLNAQHRSEAHKKAAPRRNHGVSTKRNVVRDAAEEYFYTSQSVYASHNDTDPEPPELTFNTVDYGDSKVCSKGCYRSHHRQLREWRSKAKAVEEQRQRENEQFSIANQLAIQQTRRLQLQEQQEGDGGMYAYPAHYVSNDESGAGRSPSAGSGGQHHQSVAAPMALTYVPRPPPVTVTADL